MTYDEDGEPTHGPGVYLDLDRDVDHDQAHRAGMPYLGCPACVAAGVYLCPGCFTPGPGANGLGWHTGCLPAWRLALFVLYVAVALGLIAAAVVLAFAYRTAALTGASLGLIAVLAWPHRHWFLALRHR